MLTELIREIRKSTIKDIIIMLQEKEINNSDMTIKEVINLLKLLEAQTK